MWYSVYTVCDIMKQMKETKLFAKQLKTSHNTLHAKKFANRLYRVTVLYSFYYPKLKKHIDVIALKCSINW